MSSCLRFGSNDSWTIWKAVSVPLGMSYIYLLLLSQGLAKVFLLCNVFGVLVTEGLCLAGVPTGVRLHLLLGSLQLRQGVRCLAVCSSMYLSLNLANHVLDVVVSTLLDHDFFSVGFHFLHHSITPASRSS